MLTMIDLTKIEHQDQGVIKYFFCKKMTAPKEHGRMVAVPVAGDPHISSQMEG